jgi:hypothetical protein
VLPGELLARCGGPRRSAVRSRRLRAYFSSFSLPNAARLQCATADTGHAELAA